MTQKPLPKSEDLDDFKAQMAQMTGVTYKPWRRQDQGYEFKERPKQNPDN